MARTYLSMLGMVAALSASSASAQTADAPRQNPSPNAAPTLSDKLSQTNGVIPAPNAIDPGITKSAPNPDPGTTPIIPPVGTPGNAPSVQPK